MVNFEQALILMIIDIEHTLRSDLPATEIPDKIGKICRKYRQIYLHGGDPKKK